MPQTLCAGNIYHIADGNKLPLNSNKVCFVTISWFLLLIHGKSISYYLCNYAADDYNKDDIEMKTEEFARIHFPICTQLTIHIKYICSSSKLLNGYYYRTYTTEMAIMVVTFMWKDIIVFCFPLPLSPYFLNGHKSRYILHLWTKQFIYHSWMLHWENKNIWPST